LEDGGFSCYVKKKVERGFSLLRHLFFRLECLDSGRCSSTDTRFQHFNRLLIKAAEHTVRELFFLVSSLLIAFTLVGIRREKVTHIFYFLLEEFNFIRHLNWTHWSNPSFHSVQYTEKGFKQLRSGWNEQRSYLFHALKSLGDHPLVDDINQALLEMNAVMPSTSEFKREENMRKIFNCSNIQIRFSNTGGYPLNLSSLNILLAIDYLFDVSRNINWAGEKNPLAEFHYISHSQEDFDEFFSQYLWCPVSKCWWTRFAFGKTNCSTGGARHEDFIPSIASLWSKESEDVYSFLVEMEMPRDSFTTFG